VNGQPHSVSGLVPPASIDWAVLHGAGTWGEQLRKWALWYASMGWWVFPQVAFGKRPATRHGLKDATIFGEQIKDWWNGDRLYNIGIATGSPGPDVLDVDDHGERGNGWPAFNRLKQAGLLAGAHRLVKSPSGGLHAYFAGTDQKSGALAAEHLDFKSRGGCITVPPSRLRGAMYNRYELIEDRPPTGATFSWDAAKRLLSPPKPVPARRVSRHGHGSAGNLVRWIAEQGAGNRNSALFWAACRAAEAGDEQVLLDLVEAAVQAGLERDEARRTVISAARRVTGNVS
jgi:Bifunctional DNA primase/polymerase, N-terminal/Primase C terminal 1 (PriCT-1)